MIIFLFKLLFSWMIFVKYSAINVFNARLYGLPFACGKTKDVSTTVSCTI